MTKTARISILVIILLVIAGIIWQTKKGPSPEDLATNPTVPVSVSETTKVSNTLSEFQNAELGFSVKYPSVWQKEEGNSGVIFVVPIDSAASTVGSLRVSVQAIGGACAFPPVTTVKERSTLKVGELSFNTISMSNTVQGREYFNRMYSLESGEICYMFSFASITSSPSSKGLKGSNATQAENNNKAIINAADAAFISMVKSFTFVTGPKGEDETQVAPVR